jgi:hypothetical protein
VHRTDAAREYACDRPSKIGQLDKAWDEAKAKGVDTRRDEAGLEGNLFVREIGREK